MINQKIIINPPAIGTKDSNYINYITNLVTDSNLSVEIVKSVPLVIVSNPHLSNVSGFSVGNSQVIIQNEVEDMHDKQLEELTDYFSQKGISANATIGYQKPQKLKNEGLSSENEILWAIEISSEDNLWNEIFGTAETKLAKQVDIPCLCIPTEFDYEKPKTLLLLSNNSNDIENIIPTDIINKFNLDTFIMFDGEDSTIKELNEIIKKQNLNTTVEIVKANFTNKENSLNEFIELTNPSWIAYHNFDKNFVERAFNMNTNNFILSANRPVLIMKTT